MFKKIKLENIELSKIVCGTNQFIGIIHRPNPIDIRRHKKRFKDAEAVADFMIPLVQELGVNCCVSSPRQKIYDAIKITEEETGEKFHWICTPSIRKTVGDLEGDLFKQIEWCADHGVSVCGPHRIYTDLSIDKEKLVIGGTDFIGIGPVKFKSKIFPVKSIKNLCAIPFPEISAKIRDSGMIPLLSTHYIESIKAVEKQEYDAPLVIQPLNKKGYMSNAKPDALIEAIRSTKVKILNIKPMAAGRIKPRAALEYCLENIKRDDLLAVGFGKKEYLREDIEILKDLQSTRGG
ncbi:MAG: hypothetical protein ACTSUE_04960 [Promethearchaeota archaeon]